MHLERTGGTSIREFFHLHQRQDWECVGQACDGWPRGACVGPRHVRSPQTLLELLLGSSGPLGDSCRLFGEFHNNEWRLLSKDLLSAARALAPSSSGCKVTTLLTLREPEAQVLSEVLFFDPKPDDAPGRVSAGIRINHENLVVRLGLLSPRIAATTPHLSAATVAEWARQLCREVLATVDRLHFHESLVDDWRELANEFNLSRAPLPHAAHTSSRAPLSNLSALRMRHGDELLYHNRLSRALFELLSRDTRRLASRCDAPVHVPSLLLPPPPPSPPHPPPAYDPPPPPSPPPSPAVPSRTLVCVARNTSGGCRRWSRSPWAHKRSSQSLP
jgi:hypothetical protein